MRNAFLAGASALALALGGCSMFHGNDNNASSAGYGNTAPGAPTSQPPAGQPGAFGDQSSQNAPSRNQSSQSPNDNALSGSSTNPDQSSMSSDQGMSNSGNSSNTSNLGISSNLPSGRTAATSGSGSGTNTAMTADKVREAQQKLKDDGDYQGQVDGKFGKQTAQAVKDFQQKNGLRQTGRLDRETMIKLGVSATSGSGSSMAPDHNKTMNNTNGKAQSNQGGI